MDGDREEAEYTNSQGEAEVVSFSSLSPTVDNLLQVDADPACQDSMLLLDSDLESISDCDMEVDQSHILTQVMTQYHLQKMLNKARKKVSTKVEGMAGVGEEVVEGVLVEVVEGVLVEVVEGVFGRDHGRGRRSRGLGSSDSSVDKEWKWEKEWNDDSSISAPPEFDEDKGPKHDVINQTNFFISCLRMS